MSNVEKALGRLRALVEEGQYYEAQQSYKSTYHRTRTRKQAHEAYRVLQEGATQQLLSGQTTCGVELGLLLIEAYTEDGVAPDGPEHALQSICSLIAVLPPPAPSAADSAAAAAASPQQESRQEQQQQKQQQGPEDTEASSSAKGSAAVQECSRLVAAAVKWGQRRSDLPSARQIHAAYARWLWDSCGVLQLGLAVAHFARGSDVTSFSEALRSCASRAGPHEADLFVTRGVLTVLAAAQRRVLGLPQQQLEHAGALLGQCVGWCDAGTPRVHFLELLLQALRARSPPLVRLLTERYAPSLGADPGLLPLLNRAASVYAPSSSGGKGGAGGLGGLLGGLLHGLGEGGSSDEEG